jgi:hypothetical protein
MSNFVVLRLKINFHNYLPASLPWRYLATTNHHQQLKDGDESIQSHSLRHIRSHISAALISITAARHTIKAILNLTPPYRHPINSAHLRPQAHPNTSPNRLPVAPSLQSLPNRRPTPHLRLNNWPRRRAPHPRRRRPPGRLDALLPRPQRRTLLQRSRRRAPRAHPGRGRRVQARWHPVPAGDKVSADLEPRVWAGWVGFGAEGGDDCYGEERYEGICARGAWTVRAYLSLQWFGL